MIGSVDKDRICIWDIDPIFNNCCSDKDIDLALFEGVKNRIELIGMQLPVPDCYARLGEQFFDPICDSNRAFRTPFQRNNFVRLDKLLANLGITTRRTSVEFIKKNNITVAIGEDEYQEFDHTTNSLITKRKEILKRVSYSTIVYPPAVRFNDEPLEFVKQ